MGLVRRPPQNASNRHEDMPLPEFVQLSSRWLTVEIRRRCSVSVRSSAWKILLKRINLQRTAKYLTVHERGKQKIQASPTMSTSPPEISTQRHISTLSLTRDAPPAEDEPPSTSMRPNRIPKWRLVSLYVRYDITQPCRNTLQVWVLHLFPFGAHGVLKFLLGKFVIYDI